MGEKPEEDGPGEQGGGRAASQGQAGLTTVGSADRSPRLWALPAGRGLAGGKGGFQRRWQSLVGLTEMAGSTSQAEKVGNRKAQRWAGALHA